MMVHDKSNRDSAFSSGFDSGGIVRKKAANMFDSVRSTSSVDMLSQSSSGGDDTGEIKSFICLMSKVINLLEYSSVKNVSLRTGVTEISTSLSTICYGKSDELQFFLTFSDISKQSDCPEIMVNNHLFWLF